MTWRKRNVKIPMHADDAGNAGNATIAELEPCGAGCGELTTAGTASGEPGIGQSVHIQGELTGHEDVTIEGRVDGRITVQEHSLTVGPTGVIRAEIRARSVLVEGQVVGNITADDRVEIAESGSVIGDIRAARVVLAEGARFRGSIDMGLDLADLDDDASVGPQAAWGETSDAGDGTYEANYTNGQSNGHTETTPTKGRAHRNGTAAAAGSAGDAASGGSDGGFGAAAGNALASLFDDADAHKVGM